MPDAGKGSRIDEGASLLNLTGELQDLIITNLHPPAAIALRQTNRHFNACVHRPSRSDVIEYLQGEESLPIHWDDYACYTCLRLKPRSCFAIVQTRSPRGKGARGAEKRFCLDCGLKTHKLLPGQTLKIGSGLSSGMIVYCGGCETLKGRFCTKCRWCDGCIRVGTATVLRKCYWNMPIGVSVVSDVRNDDCAIPWDEASEVVLKNICQGHIWAG